MITTANIFTLIKPIAPHDASSPGLVNNDILPVDPIATENDQSFSSLISTALLDITSPAMPAQGVGTEKTTAHSAPTSNILTALTPEFSNLPAHLVAQDMGQNQALTTAQSAALQKLSAAETSLADLKTALQEFFGLTADQEKISLINGKEISLDNLANGLAAFKNNPEQAQNNFMLGQIIAQGLTGSSKDQTAPTAFAPDMPDLNLAENNPAQKIETVMTQLLKMQQMASRQDITQIPEQPFTPTVAPQTSPKSQKNDTLAKNMGDDNQNLFSKTSTDDINLQLNNVTAQNKNKNPLALISASKSSAPLTSETALTPQNSLHSLHDPLVKSVDLLNQQALNNYGQALKSSSSTNPQVVQTVSLQLIKGAQGKFDNFNIQLTPASLGTIEAKIKIQKDGSLRAHLTADSQDALTALQRDQNQLIDSLRLAGLDLKDDALSFDLKEQNQHSTFSHNDNNEPSENFGTKHASYQSAQTINATLEIHAQHYITQTGINILV